MKSTLLSIFCLYSVAVISQTKDTTLLIIPCKSGELIIDGYTKGRIDAEDAHPEKFSFGDHYIQLKTEEGKLNSAIKVSEALTSTIIRLGCDTKAVDVVQAGTFKTTGNAREPIRLLDKQVSLGGSFSGNPNDSYFGLDEGDELNIQCSILNKKGSATLALTQFENGMEIYRKINFSEISNEKVRIPKKGIYHITLTTGALFGKDAQLVLDRIPAPASDPAFKTTVHVVVDTVPTEVMNSMTRVYSAMNLSHPNRSTLRIDLPANTTYWAYYIGLDQASGESMKNFVSSLSPALKLISADPLVLYGLQAIQYLPMLNTPSTICYRFMDSRNTNLFAVGQPANALAFKYGDNISSDFSVVGQYVKDLTICMWNNHSTQGQDVRVKVVSFWVRRRLTMDE